MPIQPPVYRPPGWQSPEQRNRERMARDTGKRLRGRAAMARRAFWLSMHPLCAPCLRHGRTTLATQVDHVLAIEHGGVDYESNYQSICVPCHREKTARERKR